MGLGEERETIVQKTLEAFRQELPDLSRGWQPPTFAVKLDVKSVQGMNRELLGMDESDDYWTSYYELRGIGTQSKEHVLPSSLRSMQKQRDSDEYRRRRDILEDHLAQAIWPVIKSMPRSSLQSPSFASRVLRANQSSWDQHLWYWSIGHVFLSWYDYVTNEYLRPRKQSMDSLKQQIEETQDSQMHGDLLRSKLDTERRYWGVEFSTLHGSELKTYSLHWWLAFQGVYLTREELDQVTRTLGPWYSLDD